ncbi:4Fe-4S binding protein [Candidatus Bipolaricaulota bacterium]|nr:4Fe-4S binding protein [Candidatus Bipolaricaulota bacterium]
MMRGLICYYSGSGNTQLACEAIAARVGAIDFELFDVTTAPNPDLALYDLIGFATWAAFFNPPQRMKTFLESVPGQAGKPAFVFNTFGSVTARTLGTLDGWVRARGFHVIAGHSLHTPENYPPMIKRGLDFKDSPNEKELAAFETFIGLLDGLTKALAHGETVPARRMGWTRLFPAFARTHSRRSMGEKFVDAEACTECGICRDRCPYGAITLDPKPVFDQSKCYGCWACYNHCPTQAISTRKVAGVTQYARPNDELLRKLDSA